jgi:hypothetical protein
MTVAKINTQHDYISARVTFAPKVYVTLTQGRYGTKASGTIPTPDLHTVFGAFDNFMRVKNAGTYAERMAEIARLAEDANTPDELADALRSARV